MTQTQECPLYEVFELAYEHSTSMPNKFDVPVTSTFVSESGKRYQVDGFYDGDDVYRVRFMPTMTGTWTYRATIEERIIDEGTFLCGPSDIRGPLRQDEQYPYHFRFSNGDPFYMMGNTAYHALVTYRKARKKFCEFLDYYAARRFNWNRFMLAMGQGVDGTGPWPWGGTPEEPEYSTFDLQTFREAEDIIKEMAARDMIASVILLVDLALERAGDSKMDTCKRYVRYAVARLGAYWNVVWNLFNEWNKFCVFDYDETDELGQFLHTIDPYQRLTACHHYARFEFYDREWTDMSSMQHRGLPGEVNRVVLQNRAFGKIVLNEEYGYEGDTIRPPSDPDNVRHDHWAIATAGGYGTYGDKTKGRGIGVYFTCNLDDAVETSTPDKLQYLQAFMEKTGYRQMIPANAFLSDCNPEEVFCIANPGQEYIVYMVRGQDVRINLAHVQGSVSVTWYNPRNGEPSSAEEVYVFQRMDELPEWALGQHTWLNMHKHHNIAFSPPDTENDWVLYLKKRDDSRIMPVAPCQPEAPK